MLYVNGMFQQCENKSFKLTEVYFIKNIFNINVQVLRK